MISGWAPALRIAWRTARHHRGRTALVAVLVALPVLIGGFLDVVARTAQLPTEEKVRRFMGAADAFVVFEGWCGSITAIQYYDHRPSGVVAGECSEEPLPVPNIASLLPPGTSVVPAYGLGKEAVRVRSAERTARLSLQEQEVASPLLDGILRLRSGRLPAAADEVMATPAALDRLEADVGDRVTVDGGNTVVVVGTYVMPDDLHSSAITGLPGWTGLPAPEAGEGWTATAFLADLPPGTDVLALQRELLADGVIVAPREHVLDPPPEQVADVGSTVSVDTVGLLVLVVGFGLLEIVLLAGTAFAVGARRQVRDLGLVAATGGEARHVRRIVLAQGVVIGLLGAAVAIPVAIAAVFFGRPWLDRANGALLGPLDVRGTELLALVTIGVLAGLAAASVPAFAAARLPVLDALNKRFKSMSLRARWPRVGVVLLAVGVALSAGGAGLWRNAQVAFGRDVARWEEAVALAPRDALEPAGKVTTAPALPFPEPPSDTLFLALMLVGFSLAAFGLALSSSALVATVARLGRHLPLSARLALRDAGRHRHRTGPAVAAIMTAVAGSVALSFFVLSNDVKNDEEYSWGLPLGQAHVQVVYGETLSVDFEKRLLAAVEHASNELPATSVVPLRTANFVDRKSWSDAWVESLQPGCVAPGEMMGSTQIAVDDGAALAIVGDVPPEARSALLDGHAVVTSCEFIRNGETSVIVSDARGERRVSLPATYVPYRRYWAIPPVVISPATAARLGLPGGLSSVLIGTDRMPTRDEEDRAQEVLDADFGAEDAFLRVERGYEEQGSVAFLALLGGSAFVTLVGTAIAVALAGAESRADHATLVAVGAEPSRRRLLAMGQAGTVSVLGVGLGVLLGTIVGSSILGGDEALPFVVPWLPLAEIAIGIPLVGVLIAGLFTRSRLPLERRIT